MAILIFALKAYVIVVITIMIIYMLRHLIFTLNRVLGEQRLGYHDIIDSDLPKLSVLIPMHNEDLVAPCILNTLIMADYPRGKLEIIPIDDHSTDKTGQILDEYASRYRHIKPLHRTMGSRGKPAALNDGLKVATGDVILVFDADYIPTKGMLKDLANAFRDPEVGAVMGRVVPVNVRTNLCTRLLDLERTGGYQVDQQARYNLKLIPQYGGTVGGFRRDVVLGLGGFKPDVLAEDTELTYRLYVKGWKVVYANRVECYEEVPEDWSVRANQIRRWSRGHNQAMFKHFSSVLRSPYLSFAEKLDGILLLFIYAVPLLLITGLLDSLALFFLNEMQIISSLIIFLFIAGYNTFGNFAPFYQVGTALFLDNSTRRIRLLPVLLFSFFFNIWYVMLGFFDAILDVLAKRRAKWKKTPRAGEPVSVA